MQFRRMGLKYQLIRNLRDPVTNKNRQKVLGAFPLSVSHVDDIEDAVWDTLTEKEQEQLEVFLEDRETRKRQAKRAQRVVDAPEAFDTAAARLEDAGTVSPEQLLDAYTDVSKAIAKDGFIADMAVRSMDIVARSMRTVPLLPDEAKTVIRAWLKLKKQLAEQGYTVSWYNNELKQKTGASS